MNFGGCYLFPTESIRFYNSKKPAKNFLMVRIGPNSTYLYDVTGFSLGLFTHGGTSAGGKSVNGGGDS